MRESDARRDLGTIMRGNGFHTQAIEDEVTPGVADFFYWRRDVSGAIELKFLTELPKRDGTVVKVWSNAKGHRRFLMQTAWLLRLWHVGVPAHVLIRIEKPSRWVMLAAPRARELALGAVTSGELRRTGWEGTSKFRASLTGFLLSEKETCARA